MKKLIRRIIQTMPGFAALDRFLCYRYTGEYQPYRFPHGHFYSPIPYLEDVKDRAETLFCKDVNLGPSIALRADEQRSLFTELARYGGDFHGPDRPTPQYRYHLEQRSFGRADGLLLFSMLRHFRPRRVIEIGSGFSSALMLDTNERFLDHSIGFTFIEPFPKRLDSLLSDKDREQCRIVRDRVQAVPLSTFAELEAGDMLFVDSSHVSKIGSDVNYIVFDVLPVLVPGVIVHFHDIYWPFEYPQHRILEGCAWNEDYVLRAFLQYNDVFEIMIFNSYLRAMHADFVQRALPEGVERSGSSLWMRKKDDVWTVQPEH